MKTWLKYSLPYVLDLEVLPEAKVRLNEAMGEVNTPLQSHAYKIRELMNIAYPDAPEGIREQILDQYVNTLGIPDCKNIY